MTRDLNSVRPTRPELQRPTVVLPTSPAHIRRPPSAPSDAGPGQDQSALRPVAGSALPRFAPPGWRPGDAPASGHLAFGYGPHQCLGQFLAKMEIEAFFRALVARVERIEATGAPAYTQATFVTGLRSLPARCVFA